MTTRLRSLGLVLAAALVLLTGTGLPVTAAAAPPATTGTPSRWCDDLATGGAVADFLGDSITEGGTASSPARRWTALFDAALRGEGYGVQVWNGGGVPGSATADFLPGAPLVGHIEFTVNRPSLVVMAWGINDWWRQIPPETYAANLQALIDRVHQLSPSSTIALIHTPWVYNADLINSRPIPQSAYRDALRQVARANWLPYLGTEWGYPGDDYGAFASPDRVHLNDAGQLAYYATIRAWLLGMCGRG